MGDFFQIIVDKDASLDEAESLAPQTHAWLVQQGIVEPERSDCVLSTTGLGYRPSLNYKCVVSEPIHDYDLQGLSTNGLEIIIGRMVFDSGQGRVAVSCPHCHIPIANAAEWTNAIDNWYSNKGAGILNCPSCGVAQAITEWTFNPAWGFGNLGFRFWNWPSLKKSFIEDVAQKLRHRIVFIAGKL